MEEQVEEARMRMIYNDDEKTFYFAKRRVTDVKGNARAVCPVTLLFKDHKGWSKEMGTVPPTRHVAGGHVGMNLYLSDIVSDIMEPLVGNIQCGKEVISTEDMIANALTVNEGMVGWSYTHTWHGSPSLTCIKI